MSDPTVNFLDAHILSCERCGGSATPFVAILPLGKTTMSLCKPCLDWLHEVVIEAQQRSDEFLQRRSKV